MKVAVLHGIISSSVAAASTRGWMNKVHHASPPCDCCRCCCVWPWSLLQYGDIWYTVAEAASPCQSPQATGHPLCHQSTDTLQTAVAPSAVAPTGTTSTQVNRQKVSINILLDRQFEMTIFHPFWRVIMGEKRAINFHGMWSFWEYCKL